MTFLVTVTESLKVRSKAASLHNCCRHRHRGTDWNKFHLLLSHNTRLLRTGLAQQRLGRTRHNSSEQLGTTCRHSSAQTAGSKPTGEPIPTGPQFHSFHNATRLQKKPTPARSHAARFTTAAGPRHHVTSQLIALSGRPATGYGRKHRPQRHLSLSIPAVYTIARCGATNPGHLPTLTTQSTNQCVNIKQKYTTLQMLTLS